MIISDEFNLQPWASRLARRKDNFILMLEHMANFIKINGFGIIIETGTAWDKGNFEGQGQSTLIWDWFSKISGPSSVEIISIDITQANIDMAKSQTNNVDFICSDSVMALSKMDELVINQVGLLYLDSFDWIPEQNLESSFHHMAELATIYSNLPSGCMIAVDDRHGDMKGKHWMVQIFMEHYLKLDPVFKNHQIAWVKA